MPQPTRPANFSADNYQVALSPILNFWVWLKPKSLDDLLAESTPPNIKEYYKFIEDSVGKRRAEEEVLRKSGAGENQGRKDMFHYLFSQTDESGNPAYSTDELNAEANMLLIAGSDTTATTMVGFWFYLTRCLRVYDKLAQEIRTAFKSAGEIQIGATLSSCK